LTHFGGKEKIEKSGTHKGAGGIPGCDKPYRRRGRGWGKREKEKKREKNLRFGKEKKT